MPSKQDNYLRMHHPSLYKGMKKGGKIENYNKGGKVKCYAQGGRNTDTVPAMLTVGETVLNEDQQIALGNMVGGNGYAGGGKVREEGLAKAAALFKHIGVPGYQEGEGYVGRKELVKKDIKEENLPKYTTDRYNPDWLDKVSALGHFGEQAQLLDTRGTDMYAPAVLGGYKEPDPSSPSGYGEEKYNITDIVKNRERREHLAYEKRKKMVGKELEEEGLIKYAGGGLVDKKDALMAYYMGGRVYGTKKKKKKKKSTY